MAVKLYHQVDFESEDARQLAALWRAPVIVTTAIAFFETLASNSTGTLRHLHGLFVDESHAALPETLLPVMWKWINILVDEWSCYWVLALGSLRHFWMFSDIAGESTELDISEIAADPVREERSDYEDNHIFYQQDLSPKSTAELAEWICMFSGPHRVILNTVQSAAVLADRCP